MPPHSKSPIEGQISSSGFRLQWNSQLRHVSQEMFVSGTHQMHFFARIHDHRQMLVLITCSDHRKFLTNHTTSGPGKSCESRRSGRFRRFTWRQDISQDRRQCYHVFRLCTVADNAGGATSDDDETGVKSTQFAQKKKPPDTILPNVADS